MDSKDELHRRREAIRLRLTDTPAQEILRCVQRSRAWLSKWRQRFQRKGWRGLRSRSRRPRHRPGAHSRRIVRLIVPTRRRLARQRVGLIGPRAIRCELRQLGLGKRTPSLATINRVLRAQGLSTPPVEPALASCPVPQTTLSRTWHALDWTCRYLEHGPKVNAFHCLNLRTRACTQTIASDKSSATLRAHVLTTWQSLGIPHFLQLDNDAVFNAGYKAPRIFGQFVRLCLYLGVELIFLPVAEPERNGDVEQLNRLWGYAFFDKRHFASVRHMQRASPVFVHWYLTQYAPPKLGEQTPQQAQRAERRCRLTQRQIVQLPDPMPITAGRIHFIRQVSAAGTITLFNETWHVSRRLAGKYVWATVTTHMRRLDIWYQRSAAAQKLQLATSADSMLGQTIHASLAAQDLLPSTHLMDAAFIGAELLVQAKQEHQLDILGPAMPNVRWQAKDAKGFSQSDFRVDWQSRTVTCPRAQVASSWTEQTTKAGQPFIYVRFKASVCRACPVRSDCTRSVQGARSLMLHPQAEYEALQAARRNQATAEFRQQYAKRSGIEGTISQGTRAFGLRAARYVGLAKARLQVLATATAINLHRLFDWWTEVPRAATRVSSFARLAPEPALLPRTWRTA